MQNKPYTRHNKIRHKYSTHTNKHRCQNSALQATVLSTIIKIYLTVTLQCFGIDRWSGLYTAPAKIRFERDNMHIMPQCMQHKESFPIPSRMS